MNKQIYIKVDNCPLDIEEIGNIPTYQNRRTSVLYVKLNVCEYVGDYKNMSIVDVELTEQNANKNAGEFNGFGTIPSKDFLPCCVECFEFFEEEELKEG